MYTPQDLDHSRDELIFSCFYVPHAHYYLNFKDPTCPICSSISAVLLNGNRYFELPDSV